ncbi:MAG: hypothetical protein KKA64_00930 [Nanoarchaeota archaeon]|nr:hypothetical protein [Nanoarchaeota archaeon]
MINKKHYTQIAKIDAYIENCLHLTPEQRLHYAGRLLKFSYRYMTPEGRKAFNRFKSSILEKKVG